MVPSVMHRRGILLHGEPGCGKTLAVRALAGACCRANSQRPVALFARKAADCLGKHYGDAERTLRLLFEEVQAARVIVITAPLAVVCQQVDALCQQVDISSSGSG
jgi:SpoVK/Ycf46/Vps4 family AAA+-type ATPase